MRCVTCGKAILDASPDQKRHTECANRIHRKKSVRAVYGRGFKHERKKPYSTWMLDWLKSDSVDHETKRHLDAMYTQSWGI